MLARLGGHDPARIPAVLELVGLADRADDRFGQYSLGMKQRLGIAAALLGEPDLLVLDEPTNGLDPVGISDMRDLIGRIAADDRTVLVSSHLLAELEQVVRLAARSSSRAASRTADRSTASPPGSGARSSSVPPTRSSSSHWPTW